MKKLITTLGLIALVAFSSVCAYAQTNTVVTNSPSISTNLVVPAPSINKALEEIVTALETSGLATATNYAIEPYLTYAPDAKDKIGGGLFLCYNVNQFVGTGLGVDYLGQFSLVSAEVQLKVPFRPFKNTGISWATNIVVAPFALAGVGKSLSGGGDGAIAVTDAGAYVQFGHLWGGSFNSGFAYGRWDNAGAYSGPRYHVFAGWSKGF